MLRYIIALIFLFSFMTSNIALADNIFIVVMKKQEEKKKRGWSLTDWLITKRQIDAQNMWLALNSSANIFEFFIDGRMGNYKFTDSANSIQEAKHDKTAYGGGIYASIFGVEFEQDKTNEKSDEWSALFGLRIFGTAVQGTNLTLGYGTHQFNFSGGEKYKNQFWQAKINLNLLSFFGIESMYREYLSSQGATTLEGYLLEYGLYLDLSFLRIYGNIFREDLEFTTTGVTSSTLRKGAVGGVKIFF